MKKNKLYTVGKNLYYGLQPGSSQMNNNPFGLSALTPPAPYINWSDHVQRAQALGTVAAQVGDFRDNYIANNGNAFGINDSNGSSGKGGFNLSDTAKGIISGASGVVGNMLGSAIRGGYSTGGVGQGISTAANVAGDVLSVIPGVGTLASPIVKTVGGIVGGAYDRAFGVKTDQAKLNAANAAIDYYKSQDFNYKNLDDIESLQETSFQNPYKNGWATSKGSKMNADLFNNYRQSKDFAIRGQENAADNILADQLDDQLANYSAFGGPLGTMLNNGDMGVIEYDFLRDYLTEKRRQSDIKSKMSGGPVFLGGDTPSTFALGGDLQPVSRSYSVGKLYDVTEEEANRLKSMGYEFTVVG